MAKKRAGEAATKVAGVNGSRGKRKLTDEQVLELVASYKPRSVTLKMLAAQYGISVGSVHAIIKGRSYAWLTGIGVAEAIQEAA